MIKFRQKEFSEYDAMRSLYVEITKDPNWKRKYGVIDSSALIPILRGNNIVIERFVISTSFARKDRYRMYLKIGAKAKLPDEVRLPSRTKTNKLGSASINFNTGVFKQKNNSDTAFPVFREKMYGKGGPPPTISGNISHYIDITYEVKTLLGDAIKYDKKERSLVLEFDSIQDAIKALDILPFGMNYKIYLLNL